MTADFNPRFVKDQLRAFVERVQRLEEDIKTINDDKRDVYAEAKGNGFDVPALKAVVAYLRKDRDEAEERRAIFDLYLDNVVGTEHATRAPARLPPPTKKSPSVAHASLSDGAARSVSPTPERAASIESVMSTDGAACTVIPPPRPPVQAATDSPNGPAVLQPLVSGGEGMARSDPVIAAGPASSDDLDITKQPWKAGLDALKASA